MPIMKASVKKITPEEKKKFAIEMGGIMFSENKPIGCRRHTKRVFNTPIKGVYIRRIRKRKTTKNVG